MKNLLCLVPLTGFTAISKSWIDSSNPLVMLGVLIIFGYHFAIMAICLTLLFML